MLPNTDPLFAHTEHTNTKRCVHWNLWAMQKYVHEYVHTPSFMHGKEGTAYEVGSMAITNKVREFTISYFWPHLAIIFSLSSSKECLWSIWVSVQQPHLNFCVRLSLLHGFVTKHTRNVRIRRRQTCCIFCLRDCIHYRHFPIPIIGCSPKMCVSIIAIEAIV